MYGSCCGFDSKKMSEKFNVKIDETVKGIKILVEPKDETKVESFKKFVDSAKEWCDCGPNCC
jgi:hypothetical protein